ncbi:hypothetical protein BFJ63_vAg1580 [Fusarium oxysporum f. sp. narcissi]|uniref:Uncharacterized protein n=2 Tax=Fusarium oxysporum TaxID=5507 RepID=A0A420PYT4_FUSOX|nr:hypothetical protein BFJ68_g13927 [Fusarium oxysporum]RYC95767.1 hypothetical protein BFJ63_vAg1580 [Fusarium oxysporum f. sp. narcissi]
MALPAADPQEHPAWIYNPSADIQEYPDWIHDPEVRTPRFDGGPRCRRSIFVRLKQALTHGGHRLHQRGFAIIRTAYGPESEEQFQHALTLIGRIAQVWSDDEITSCKTLMAYLKENDIEQLGHISKEVDTLPNHEFTRRYQNDIQKINSSLMMFQ